MARRQRIYGLIKPVREVDKVQRRAKDLLKVSAANV
jgi:hypothetical protein